MHGSRWLLRGTLGGTLQFYRRLRAAGPDKNSPGQIFTTPSAAIYSSRREENLDREISRLFCERYRNKVIEEHAP